MSSKEAASRVTLVVGGVRSGKSSYAQQRATKGGRVAFIATAEARDEDMARRIARHREDRPSEWTTVEAPIALSEAIQNCGATFDTIVIDCLTLWAANLMEHETQNVTGVLAHADLLGQTLRDVSASVILVSNEVGSGIVPMSELGRSYRDVLGGINQRIAAAADEVVLMVAGCPLVIKQMAKATV